MTTETFLENATAHISRMADIEISNIRNQVPTGPSPAKFCECGEELHPERAQAGYENCIDCAQDAERLKSRYAQ